MTSVGGVYAHYFYNRNWQVLETRETASHSAQPEDLQARCQYVWSRRYADAAVLRDENTDQDGLCDDERLYYVADANFNVTTLVDTGGDAIERYLYDAYGRVTVYDGTWSNARSTSSYENPLLFTGQHFDWETRLYLYRNRSYDAQLGRFIQRDPIGYGSGMNVYAYVDNSPLMWTDPTGEDWRDWPGWPWNWPWPWNPEDDPEPEPPAQPRQPLPAEPGRPAQPPQPRPGRPRQPGRPRPIPAPPNLDEPPPGGRPIFLPPEVPEWFPPGPGQEFPKALELCGEAPKIGILNALRRKFHECPTEENHKRLLEAQKFFEQLELWQRRNCGKK